MKPVNPGGGRYRPAPAAALPGGTTASNRSTFSEVSVGRRTLSVTGPQGSRFLSHDVLGSVRTATGTTGMVIEHYQYDAYGETLSGATDHHQPYGYNGKPRDPATGLTDYGFRDYLPQAGRFVTVDPIKDGVNWYAYVNADPVNFVDAWGLEAIPITPGAVLELTEFGYGEDPNRLVERQALAKYVRELPMYQPGAGGNYGKVGEGFTWCNQAVHDYTAATSPGLFQAMTGGRDRRNTGGPVDPSYNVTANAATDNLRRAAALSQSVADSPYVARAIEAGGTRTTIREVDEQTAQRLANEGLTVVAARSVSGGSGHLGIVARDERDFDPEAGALISDVGGAAGDLRPRFEAFRNGDLPRYYYDTAQKPGYIDYTQLGNSNP